MSTHLSVRNLDFAKAFASGKSSGVMKLFKQSIAVIHKQYRDRADFHGTICSKVSKIFARLFVDAWDDLSEAEQHEIRELCDLHYNKEAFEKQDWKSLLKI